MPVDIEQMQIVAEIEATLDPEFSPLAPGTYHVKLDGESDAYLGDDSMPVMKLVFTVLEGENEGRKHFEFLRFFAKEDPTKTKTLEERQHTTRNITRRVMNNIVVKSLADHPQSTEEWAFDALSVVKALDGEEDPEEVRDYFEQYIGCVEGWDFYVDASTYTRKDASGNAIPGSEQTRLSFLPYPVVGNAANI